MRRVFRENGRRSAPGELPQAGRPSTDDSFLQAGEQAGRWTTFPRRGGPLVARPASASTWRPGSVVSRAPGLTLLCLLLWSAPPLEAQSAPNDDERFVVIKAGKVITISGEELVDGVIVLCDGKVRSVGRNLEYPLNARLIDAHDRVVMPGLIDPSSRFGLPGYERKGVHGDLNAVDEYFPPPEAYYELLDAGYTALALVPAGTGIPGRAVVVRTAGPPDQRVLTAAAYLRVTADTKAFREALKKAKSEIEKVEQTRREHQQKYGGTTAAAQTQPSTEPTSQPAFVPPPIEPAYQVLVDLLQKKPGLVALIELESAADYVHMNEVLREYEITHHFLLRNGLESDFGHIVEALAARPTSLVLQPLIGRIPYSAERIHLVRMFAGAGCQVSLTPVGDSAYEHQRMLARVAGLVREGWSRDEALKSLTLHPAQLLGLAERLGSIEQGKEADLIFLDGDPLVPGVRVREVMIAGQMVHRAEVAP